MKTTFQKHKQNLKKEKTYIIYIISKQEQHFITNCISSKSSNIQLKSSNSNSKQQTTKSSQAIQANKQINKQNNHQQ